MADGAQAAQKTAESMLEVVSQAEEMSSPVSGIAEYIRQQAANTGEIICSIEQISRVIQSNAAMAEASAAASGQFSS